MPEPAGPRHGPLLRLGWTVGPWHGEGGGSRDSLVLLAVDGGAPALVGRPWRGSLTSVVAGLRGWPLLDALVTLAAPDLAAPDRSGWADLAIAIDAPLGWPDALVELQVMGLAAPDIAGQDGDRYVFRETEMALIRRGFRKPLAAVQDMPGSRSTKALHVLRTAGFEREGPGLWQLDADGRRATAVETDPAVIATAGRLRETQAAIAASPVWRALPQADEEAGKDIRDALACAVLAHLRADIPGACEPIPEHASLGEGWIVVPAGIRA